MVLNALLYVIELDWLFNDNHMEDLFIYCALLNSAQKFIEIQGWLLLPFFICLHNQISSFNSIKVQMSEKRDSSNSKNEWLPLSGLILKPGPRPWTRTQKNLDPEKPGPRKTWTLKNLGPEKPKS